MFVSKDRNQIANNIISHTQRRRVSWWSTESEERLQVTGRSGGVHLRMACKSSQSCYSRFNWSYSFYVMLVDNMLCIRRFSTSYCRLQDSYKLNTVEFWRETTNSTRLVISVDFIERADVMAYAEILNNCSSVSPSSPICFRSALVSTATKNIVKYKVKQK